MNYQYFHEKIIHECVGNTIFDQLITKIVQILWRHSVYVRMFKKATPLSIFFYTHLSVFVNVKKMIYLKLIVVVQVTQKGIACPVKIRHIILAKMSVYLSVRLTLVNYACRRCFFFNIIVKYTGEKLARQWSPVLLTVDARRHLFARFFSPLSFRLFFSLDLRKSATVKHSHDCDAA